MENTFESIKGNKKLQEGIGLIMDAVSETVEKITVEKLANQYMIAGSVSILRGIIGILNQPDEGDFISKIINLLNSCGVKKIVTTNNQLNVGANSVQRVVDVYNDPNDPNIITSLIPGYVLSTDNGDIILQYENIKINEAHYNNPIELLIKNPEENGKTE